MTMNDEATRRVPVASNRSQLPLFTPFMDYQKKYVKWLALAGERGTPLCDMAFGNPHDPPAEDLLNALRSTPLQSQSPLSPNTFAYEVFFRDERKYVSDILFERRGVRFDPNDILLCNAALGGLLATMQALTDPGDEVLCMTPSYFFYGAMLDVCGCRRVLVPTKEDFDLDIDAIRAAITPRTRVVLINSPNNPSGRIYPPQTLRSLAEMLAAANTERPIVLLSDEAYCCIVFDEVKFHSPTEFYPYSLLVYTYGKTTLAPSERLGYVALSPLMPAVEREELRTSIFKIQLTGYSFPNAMTAKALPELTKFSIDVAALQRRRDLIAETLSEDGWTVHKPEGTFYMLLKVPDGFADDEELAEILGERGVLTMPASVGHMPGWIRLSLTASDEMVERAIPIFQEMKKLGLRKLEEHAGH